MKGSNSMNLMELRLQNILQEHHTDFIDSLCLSGIDVVHGIWTSDAVEANAQAGVQSLIHYVSREEVPSQYRQAFLQMIAENLDKDGSIPIMAMIYAAYEWDGRFPPYAILQHMVHPILLRQYCAALQKYLYQHFQSYYADFSNIV